MSRNRELYTILKARKFKNIVHCTEYLYHGGYPLKKAFKLANRIYPDTLSINTQYFDNSYDAYEIARTLNGAKVKLYHDARNLYFNVDGSAVQSLKNNRVLYLVKEDQEIMYYDLTDNKLYINRCLLTRLSSMDPDRYPLFKMVIEHSMGLKCVRITY